MTRPPLSTPIASLLVASFIAQPVVGWGQELGGNNAEAAANRALAQRMQRDVQGREETAKGEAALRKKDYEAAFAHYKNACEAIVNAPATSSSRANAVDGLTIAGRRLAEQRVTEGYYASAVQLLQEVLKHNPGDKPTHKLLSNIEAPDYFNKQMTPGHRANVETVKADFIAAEGYKNLGRNNMAIKKVEQILNVDPDNIAAKKMREELYRIKDNAAMAGYDATRSQAMWEVTKEWERPYRRFNQKAIEIKSETKTSAPNTAKITRKLNEIKLPKVDFRETTIREAIEFLVQKSKTLDSENEGVNIVLKIDDQGGASAPAPAAPAPAGGGIPGLDVPGAIPAAPAGIPAVGGSGSTKITLTLNNVPLIEVIKYITNLANLKYKIEPFAVSIVPVGVSTEEMYIKEWKVPPSLFRDTPGGGAATALVPGGDPNAPVTPTGAIGSNAKDFLAARGVTFGANAFAMYSPASSVLVVKNTQDQLDLVERVVEIGITGDAIKQIEIQAKFVEITQNNLKELSFDWLVGQANVPGISTNSLFFGGGTDGTAPATNPNDFTFINGGQAFGGTPVTRGLRSGQLAIGANAIDALLFGTTGSTSISPAVASLTGIGTDPSFQVVMRALDQKKGVDLLSSPKVTTKSGNRAVIEIIREFKYPIEFEQPQIPQQVGGNVNLGGLGGIGGGGGGSGSFPVTPTTPTTFEVRNTGVTLEVEPVIGPDGYSIDMQLAPQVVEFEGFINYGSPIQTTSTDILGRSTVNVITPNVINQPIFSSRKVNTNVTVFDGATVVLGGLIREDVQKVEDKIPFLGDIPLLGRLFRSNVDQHQRRNLVIFVTARIINAEGQPIQGDDENEEAVDALPMPEAPMSALPDLKGYVK